MTKILAESLQEFRTMNSLNEEDLNESLSSKWEKIDKSDEKAVSGLVKKVGMLAQGGKGLEVLKKRILGAKLDKKIKELSKAAKYDFDGKWVIVGDDWSFKPKKAMKTENPFKSGGTGGKTNAGGV